MTYRIYFDSNEGDELNRYDLGIMGALTDIAPIAHNLKEGMRVIIYMGCELEMQATLEYDSVRGHWMARPIVGTLMYLQGGQAPSD